jgi:ribosomal-protein-alanine N-acetyltransferase
MSEFVVRRMAPGDLEQVARLDAMSFPKPWPQAAFTRELENPRARCWVVETRLVAGLEFVPPPSSPLLPITVPAAEPAVIGALVAWLVLDEFHIATLAVHPELRRQGLGQLILRQALRDALAEGARMAFLEVRESNIAAQQLYRRFGFEVTGHRPRYYGTEDAVLMTLEPLGVRAAEPSTQTEE